MNLCSVVLLVTYLKNFNPLKMSKLNQTSWLWHRVPNLTTELRRPCQQQTGLHSISDAHSSLPSIKSPHI